MVVFGVRIIRLAIQSVPKRNQDEFMRKCYKYYSTHHLAQSLEPGRRVKTPNFNKEFKGMKAEFPCLARLLVNFKKNAHSKVWLL